LLLMGLIGFGFKMNNLKDIFKIEKPIIGMIHLAGKSREEKVKKALKELIIFEEQGIDGAIIEDYHGDYNDVYDALKQSSNLGLKIIRGVNLLMDPYTSFKFADEFRAKFIQFDSVQTPDLNLERYELQRKEYPNIAVLGGIGFKYTQLTGNPLEQDLEEAKLRCEAIVTTGKGTGIETPIEKLKQYKALLPDFPLIVGAGVNQDNVYEQLNIVNGAIIGSAFKVDNNTYKQLDVSKIKDIVDVVKGLRQ